MITVRLTIDDLIAAAGALALANHPRLSAKLLREAKFEAGRQQAEQELEAGILAEISALGHQ